MLVRFVFAIDFAKYLYLFELLVHFCSHNFVGTPTVSAVVMVRTPTVAF
jgi:hypothetical protein